MVVFLAEHWTLADFVYVYIPVKWVIPSENFLNTYLTSSCFATKWKYIGGCSGGESDENMPWLNHHRQDLSQDDLKYQL